MSSLARRLASSVPSAATARLPPIERKNWIVAVAIPRFDTSTAFCVAMMYGWNVIPMPMPVMTRIPATATGGEPSPSSVSSARPPRMNTLPTIGNGR